MLRLLFLFLFVSMAPGPGIAQAIYEIKESKVRFRSKAPKELISASTVRMTGAVDASRRTFAFKIGIATFEGFNSPLQREHFNENYMETPQFPVATFVGKIIEDVDLSHDGDYSIRAKGKLTIHGVEQERIIKCQIHSAGGRITVDSDFNVPLADHDIKVPRLVVAKLATYIMVDVHAVLIPRE